MSLTKSVKYLLEKLIERASLPPPAGAQRVYVGHFACGWASPAATRALSQDYAHRDGMALIRLPQDPARLAEVADRLQAAGVLNGWRNELLDVIDDTGQVVSRVERAVMRPLGFTTRAIHLNAFTPGGDLWIAQRSLHKSTDPGLWDTLVGGLIASGETPTLALLRESHEEAGLLPADLAGGREIGQFVVSRAVPEGYQIEAVTVTDCVLDAACQPSNQDGEVSLIRTASPQEALDMIEADLFTTEASLSILLSMTRANTPEG